MDFIENQDQKGFKTWKELIDWSITNRCRLPLELNTLCNKDEEGDLSCAIQNLLDFLEKDKLLFVNDMYNNKDYKNVDKFRQDYTSSEIMDALGFTMQEYIVFKKFTDVMDNSNNLGLYLQDVAQHFGIDSKNMIKLLKSLCSKGVIVFKKPFGRGRTPTYGIIMINPRLYFKGKISNIKTQYNEFLKYLAPEVREFLEKVYSTTVKHVTTATVRQDSMYGNFNLVIFNSSDDDAQKNSPSVWDTDELSND